MHIKALFQELKVWPTLTPGGHKQFHLCASGGLQAIQDGIWAIVPWVRWPKPGTQLKTTAWGTAKDYRPGQECCRFLIQLTFPWTPKPWPTLCSPVKRAILQWNVKWSVRVQTCSLLRSLTIWIKHLKSFNPFLSFLGLVGDRQHERQFF